MRYRVDHSKIKFISTRGHVISPKYVLRFVHFRHKVKRHRWIDYRAFKPAKMAANRTNSLPNEEAISSLVCRVYRAMTEMPYERSRVSGGNSSNVEEELSRNFQISRLGAQQPPLYNPRVNYGSNGSGGNKGKKGSFTWKGKSAKESSHGLSSKELMLLPAPNVDEVPRFGKKRKLQEMGLIVGFALTKG